MSRRVLYYVIAIILLLVIFSNGLILLDSFIGWRAFDSLEREGVFMLASIGNFLILNILLIAENFKGLNMKFKSSKNFLVYSSYGLFLFMLIAYFFLLSYDTFLLLFMISHVLLTVSVYTLLLKVKIVAN